MELDLIQRKRVRIICLACCIFLLEMQPKAFCGDKTQGAPPLPPLRADGPSIDDPRKDELRRRPISLCGTNVLHDVDTADTTLLTQCRSVRIESGQIAVDIEVVNPTKLRIKNLVVVVGWFPPIGEYRENRVRHNRDLMPNKRVTIQVYFPLNARVLPDKVDISLLAVAE